jgi:hypothetical protein
VKSYEQRQKEEQARPRTLVIGCIYVIVVVAISYVMAGFLMEEFDLFNELGIRDMEIPLVNYSLEDVPEWTLHIALTAGIFLILQPLVVIVMGIFTRGESGTKPSQPPPNPWET